MATKPAAKPQQQQPKTQLQAITGGLIHQQQPEYLAQIKGNRGNEQVGTEDLIIPRLEIVQALSPCLKKTDPAYIEGCDQGMLFNNLTRELYGDEVLVMPIYFRKEFLLWVDRTKSDGAGGFRGSYPTAAAAQEKKDELTDEGEQHLQIVDTAQQFSLIVHSNARTEDIVVSMAKSKMKVSRRWNSLIRLATGDRFSRVYKITTVEEQGKKGTYYNYAVDVAGFPSKQLYDIALEKYKSIASGRVRADISGDSFDADDDHSQDGTKRSGNDY